MDFLREEDDSNSAPPALLLLSKPRLILGDFKEPTPELLLLLTPRFLVDRGDGSGTPKEDLLPLTRFCDLSVEAAELLLLLIFFFVDGEGDIISSPFALLLGFALRFFVFLLFLPFLLLVSRHFDLRADLSLSFTERRDLLLPFRLMLLLRLLSSFKSMSPISSEVSPDVSSVANSAVMFAAPTLIQFSY